MVDNNTHRKKLEQAIQNTLHNIRSQNDIDMITVNGMVGDIIKIKLAIIFALELQKRHPEKEIAFHFAGNIENINAELETLTNTIKSNQIVILRLRNPSLSTSGSGITMLHVYTRLARVKFRNMMVIITDNYSMHKYKTILP